LNARARAEGPKAAAWSQCGGKKWEVGAVPRAVPSSLDLNFAVQLQPLIFFDRPVDKWKKSGPMQLLSVALLRLQVF